MMMIIMVEPLDQRAFDLANWLDYGRRLCRAASVDYGYVHAHGCMLIRETLPASG